MKISSALILLLFPALLISCDPDDDGPTIQNSAGRGGTTALRVIPQHHGVGVDSATVYISYNRGVAPLDGRYDDSARTVVVGAGLPRMAIFDSLKPGNYYLFSKGYDPTIGSAVDGGSPYTLVRGEPVYDVYLPVGEE